MVLFTNGMSQVNAIVSSHLCSGCGTCHVVCGKEAIAMQYDAIGRLLPVIDAERCVDCGACYNICPSLDAKGIQLPKTDDIYGGCVENVFVGKATDVVIYQNAQSGGLVTSTLKYLFDSGQIDAAIVCHVQDAIQYTPRAIVVTRPEELLSCQKSSYVPIDIVSAVKLTEPYKSVAVVGTGCHIQGIRALQNDKETYRNRIKFTLGLICDRTLCKTVTDVLYGRVYKNSRKKIIWRDKTNDYKGAQVLIQTEDGRRKTLPRWHRLVLKDAFTNPRCRICFDKLNTGADMVFGDPWGMTGIDWKNGMSVAITRTAEGTRIVNEMMSHQLVELKEARWEEVVSGQKIEKKKREVSSALAHYQNKGWLLPSYAAQLRPAEENPKISRMIDGFVGNLPLEKATLIRKGRVLLYKNGIKRMIKTIFKYLCRVIIKKNGVR